MHHHTPTIVAFTGAAGSGKDTAATHLALRHDFAQLAFADVINDMLAVLLEAFGVDYAVLHERALKEQPIPQIPGNPSARELKQRLGDWGRQIHADLWVQALACRAGIQDPLRSTPVHTRLVISDVRYPNEAALVARMGGVLLRLRRQQAQAVRAHSSEEHTAHLPATMDLANDHITPYHLFSDLDAVIGNLGLDDTHAESAAA